MKSRDQTSVLLSVAAIHGFNVFKADGTTLFLVVECKESVKLDILMHYILTVVLIFLHTYVVGVMYFEIVIFDIFIH